MILNILLFCWKALDQNLHFFMCPKKTQRSVFSCYVFVLLEVKANIPVPVAIRRKIYYLCCLCLLLLLQHPRAPHLHFEHLLLHLLHPLHSRHHLLGLLSCPHFHRRYVKNKAVTEFQLKDDLEIIHNHLWESDK